MMTDNFTSEIKTNNRASVRKKGKEHRKELLPWERQEKSAVISEKLFTSDVYKRSHTVMLYKATEYEVSLEKLEQLNAESGNEKTFVYPLCISETDMIALKPGSSDAWKKGFHGITEPDPDCSLPCPPESIDLIICPCTAFDENLGRIGMGAGFYDRFIAKCSGAIAVAAAFDCQKAESTFPQEWDKPMLAIFTEEKIYRK